MDNIVVRIENGMLVTEKLWTKQPGIGRHNLRTRLDYVRLHYDGVRRIRRPPINITSIDALVNMMRLSRRCTGASCLHVMAVFVRFASFQ
jgi:hypothetical protein